MFFARLYLAEQYRGFLNTDADYSVRGYKLGSNGIENRQGAQPGHDPQDYVRLRIKFISL
jgi:hypothetical protein